MPFPGDVKCEPRRKGCSGISIGININIPFSFKANVRTKHGYRAGEYVNRHIRYRPTRRASFSGGPPSVRPAGKEGGRKTLITL